MNRFQEKFMDFMQEKGLQATRQRLFVAEQLHAMQGHPTVEELCAALRENDPGIGLATVYRTLKLLIEAGLVAEVYFGDGACRLEVARPKKSHDHLVCRRCGSVVETSSAKVAALQEKIAKQHGFTLDVRSRCLYGICASCSSIGASH